MNFQLQIDKAKAAEARYTQHNDIQGLNDAIEIWEGILNHPEFDSIDDELRLIILNDSAGTYWYSYQAIGKLADLETSISYWQQAEKLIPEDSPDLPMLLHDLASGLGERYIYCSGKLADLENSISYLQKALKLIPKDSPDLPMLFNNLANGLGERYASSGKLADLENSISYSQKAWKLTPEYSPNLPVYINNLAFGLQDRYAHCGKLEDLENSISYLQKAVKLTPEDSPQLPMFLSNLAHGFIERYARSGKLADLENSISYSQNTVEITPNDSPYFPSYINNLSHGLIQHYDHSGKLADLENSISYLQKALKLTPEDSPNLISHFHSLAFCLKKRYVHSGELTDLENSILYSQKAVDLSSEDSPDFPHVLKNIAFGLIERYARSGKLADLENSISYLKKALKLTPDDSPYLPYHWRDMAVVLSYRYDRSGKLRDLEKIISYLQKALNQIPDDSPYLPTIYNSMGVAFKDQYIRSGELADLKSSISYLQKALKRTPDDSPYLLDIFHNMAVDFSYRYYHSGELIDLENSISYSQKVLKLVPDHHIDYPTFINQITVCLLDQYAHSGELIDLENSISYSQKAVKLTPDDSPDLPSWLNNLGNGFREHYTRSFELVYLVKGIEAYQKAAEKGSKIALDEGLKSAQNWLQWAFERQSWQEVTQAYSYAYESSTRLVQTQLLRQHQESWLKDIQGLAAKAAYAYAKIEQFESATVTLEGGLAQLLTETLARERADLEDLKPQRQDLYQAYKDAIDAWQQAKFLVDIEKLNSARQKLDATIADIREIKGYEDFLTKPKFKDITIAAKNTRLIYLLTTDEGGLALIVSDNEVKPVWLPDFTQNLLEEKLNLYLENYSNWKNSENKEQGLKYKEQWYKSLEEITAWLWSSIMEPVIETLPKDANCTLIPSGLLNLLPLHAAWKADNSKPTGKYYALDALTIAYAPNARSLYAAQQIAAEISPDNLLAIQEPLPVSANRLANTKPEVETVISNFPKDQVLVLDEENATLDAIKEALPNYNVLHFSGHGFANLKNPVQSGLLMANDEELTLENLLKLRLKGIRLVTLSACETGLTGTKLPDEVVNLPTGLLQAGVAGVAASLWTVADLSTMMLISYFYDLWRIEKLEPVQALGQAQIWMRDTTNAEKLTYFEEICFGVPTVRMAEDTAIYLSHKMSDSDQRTYQHPYYWAAFGFVGV